MKNMARHCRENWNGGRNNRTGTASKGILCRIWTGTAVRTGTEAETTEQAQQARGFCEEYGQALQRELEWRQKQQNMHSKQGDSV